MANSPSAALSYHGGAQELLNKRKVAADYIQAAAGCAVPHNSDSSFRGALRDGVLLCQLINAAFPGAVQQVGWYLGSSGWLVLRADGLCGPSNTQLPACTVLDGFCCLAYDFVEVEVIAT